MPDHMDMPWMMGNLERLEMVAFWVAAVIFLLALVVALRRPSPSRNPAFTGLCRRVWRLCPEVRLLMLGLPLELLWEIAQFPLYDVWHQNDWSYILYGLAHCTLGDLLILLVCYELVALVRRDRAWALAPRGLSAGLLFTVLGAAYTVYSEIRNVRIKGTWGYTELMPLVPVVEIGGMPFLQWLLIPPVLLWLMRLTARAEVPAAS